jgi:hypothetical protein
MRAIVRRTRAKVRSAGRWLAKVLEGAVPASPRNAAGTGRQPEPEWFRFPPF